MGFEGEYGGEGPRVRKKRGAAILEFYFRALRVEALGPGKRP